MRLIAAIIVFVCCLAMSSATLKLLKSKTAPKNYKTVNLLTSDAVFPLPAPYVRITPTYTKNIATYKVSPPPVVKYAPSTTIYVTPQIYAAPAYSQSYTLGYDSSPAEYYGAPYTTYTEYSTAYTSPQIIGDCNDNSNYFDWK